ncbi:MAG: hypothetical protein WBD59_18315 [Candidatus Sulfotelmatobacter sp.]
MSSPLLLLSRLEKRVACPFFLPIEKIENGPWLHPSRLPLGGGWSGHCTAPGREGEIPSAEELHELCNLGYAKQCSRLPRERVWDSVRFDIRIIAAKDTGPHRIQVRYICEREHLPADHGLLEFDPAQRRWTKPHPDARVQRMSECFVAAYFERVNRRAAEAATS